MKRLFLLPLSNSVCPTWNTRYLELSFDRLWSNSHSSVVCCCRAVFTNSLFVCSMYCVSSESVQAGMPLSWRSVEIVLPRSLKGSKVSFGTELSVPLVLLSQANRRVDRTTSKKTWWLFKACRNITANVDGLLLGWHLKNVELGYRALLKKWTYKYSKLSL